MKLAIRTLAISTSVFALAACGAEDLGSPGTNGDINVGDITITTGSSSSGGSGVATPATGCPTIADPAGLTDQGTISGPSGEWRVCQLPAQFTVSSTLPQVSGVLYSISGRVDVGTDDGAVEGSADGVDGTKVNLTIAPGAILFGKEGVSGGSFLIVNRGSKLFADGSSSRPIIFTAESDVLGNAQDDTSALWGGVVLLGRAPVADCFAGGINQADQTKCEMRVEGIANNIPFFGGNTPTDSSGSLQYIQIRYSGFTLELGSELQSLTLGGVGTGTTLNYIQSYNSSDDGTEFFGGHVNMKHFVAVGAEDDSLDIDSGAQANIQYALVVQRDGVGDKALENDSPADDHGPGTTIPDAMPRTLTQVSNFTFWSTSTGKAIEARGAGDITLANGVIYKPSSTGQVCVNDHGETGGGRGAEVIFNSVELDCDTSTFTDTAVANGTGSVFQTLTLSDKYLNGVSETNFPTIFDNKSLSSFFDTTTYIGAVAQPAWTRGWTCDSTTVSFGSGISCKSLPVF